MTTSRPLPQSALRTASFAVAGMTCFSCGRNVRRALAGLAGVHVAEVSRSRAQAVVVYDPTFVAPAEMARAIEDAGYAARRLKIDHPAATAV